MPAFFKHLGIYREDWGKWLNSPESEQLVGEFREKLVIKKEDWVWGAKRSFF